MPEQSFLSLLKTIYYIETATSSMTGEVIGYRLKSETFKPLLLFVDQVGMPGLRVGEEFIRDIGEVITYQKI